jgi:hypothetical protein
MAATTAMIVSGRLERTRYVASLFSIVACGAVVLQTTMLAQLFSLRGSPHAVAVWAAFALAVSIPWRFGIPFAFGLLAAVAYLPALGFWLAGIPWTYALQRPEPMAAMAAVTLAIAGADLKIGRDTSVRVPDELRAWARGGLLIVILGSLLVLSAAGDVSLWPVNDTAVEVLYQIVAPLAGMSAIVAGLRRGQSETVVIGALFTGAFLLMRFVDWWWDWMPKYLFFLILAAFAIAWLWSLRIARRRLAAP